MHVNLNMIVRVETKTAYGQCSFQEAKVGLMTAVVLHIMDNMVIPQALLQCTNINYGV